MSPDKTRWREGEGGCWWDRRGKGGGRGDRGGRRRRRHVMASRKKTLWSEEADQKEISVKTYPRSSWCVHALESMNEAFTHGVENTEC